MATKFIGDITSSEKYTKDGEEKTKWTNHGALFYDEEKDRYSIKLMGTWLAVFPKKDTNQNTTHKKPNTSIEEEQIDIDSIPF